MAAEQAASPVVTLCRLATTTFHFLQYANVGFITNTSYSLVCVRVVSVLTLFPVVLVRSGADIDAIRVASRPVPQTLELKYRYNERNVERQNP